MRLVKWASTRIGRIMLLALVAAGCMAVAASAQTIYNNGTGVRSRVHYGSGYNNAFWDGTQMTYGDGPSNSKPLVALDVVQGKVSVESARDEYGVVCSSDGTVDQDATAAS